MSLAGLMNQQMAVQRLSSARDAAGGTISSWSEIAASVRCRIEDASAELRLQFASMTINITHRIFARHSDIVAGDRIVAEGNYYRAHSIQTRRGIGGMVAFQVIFGEQLVATQ